MSQVFLKRTHGPSLYSLPAMTEHQGRVDCIAAGSDGQIISGSIDMTVKAWSPRSGIIRTMAEHTGAVTCIAVRRDGQIVSGSADRAVKLWDAAQGRVVTMGEHQGRILGLSLLDDGRIASVSEDGSLKLWDAESGATWTMPDSEQHVQCLAALPDGTIAFGTRDAAVFLWDPGKGTLQSMQQHTAPVHSIAWSPAGRVVSASWDGMVVVWDPRTWDRHFMSSFHDPEYQRKLLMRRNGVAGPSRLASQGTVRCLVAPPDGSVVWGSLYGSVTQWNPDNGRVVSVHEHAERVNCLAVLPDGKIASGSDDRTVTVWDPDRGTIMTNRFHQGKVRCIAALADGTIASCSEDATVSLWNPYDRASQAENDRIFSVQGMAALPEGDVLMFNNHVLRRWNPQMEVPRIVDENPSKIYCIASLPTGGVAVGCFEGGVVRWDGSGKLTQVESPQISRSHVSEIAALPDGNIVWSNFGCGPVNRWNYNTGTVGWAYCQNRDVTTMIMSPAGQIASGEGGELNRVFLWRPHEEEAVKLQGHTDAVICLAFLEDGHLASGSLDGTVKLWNTQQGTHKTMNQHTAAVYAVAALPDGRIASAGKDHSVRLWDPESGEVHAMHEHCDEVQDLLVFPHGKIVSAGVDGTVILWIVGPRKGASHVAPQLVDDDSSPGCEWKVLSPAVGSMRIYSRHVGQIPRPMLDESPNCMIKLTESTFVVGTEHGIAHFEIVTR